LGPRPPLSLLRAGPGVNVLVRAKSGPAGLKTQQAQQPAVNAGDCGSPLPGLVQRPPCFSEAGPCRYRAARESSQWCSRSIRSLAISDVATFHNSRQVPGRADDERGMDMIIAEELPYLPDAGSQRMSGGDGQHRIGDGAHDLIHRFRIVRTRLMSVRRLAARLSGLACGLALAVRPAGPAEVSRDRVGGGATPPPTR
jgi:hypothetical protein